MSIPRFHDAREVSRFSPQCPLSLRETLLPATVRLSCVVVREKEESYSTGMASEPFYSTSLVLDPKLS